MISSCPKLKKRLKKKSRSFNQKRGKKIKLSIGSTKEKFTLFSQKLKLVKKIDMKKLMF